MKRVNGRIYFWLWFAFALFLAACSPAPTAEIDPPAEGVEEPEMEDPTAAVPTPTADDEPAPETAERLLGNWTGMVDTFDGASYPSEWAFQEDGTLIVVTRIEGNVVRFEFEYYFDPDGALRIDDGNGDSPGRREVEFLGEDEVTLTAVKDGLVTSLTRTVNGEAEEY